MDYAPSRNVANDLISLGGWLPVMGYVGLVLGIIAAFATRGPASDMYAVLGISGAFGGYITGLSVKGLGHVLHAALDIAQ